MKKFLWILALGLFLSACGNGTDKAIDQALSLIHISARRLEETTVSKAN